MSTFRRPPKTETSPMASPRSGDAGIGFQAAHRQKREVELLADIHDDQTRKRDVSMVKISEPSLQGLRDSSTRGREDSRRRRVRWKELLVDEVVFGGHSLEQTIDFFRNELQGSSGDSPLDVYTGSADNGQESKGAAKVTTEESVEAIVAAILRKSFLSRIPRDPKDQKFIEDLLCLTHGEGSPVLLLGRTLIKVSHAERLFTQQRFGYLFHMDLMDRLKQALGPDWVILIETLLEDNRSMFLEHQRMGLDVKVRRLYTGIDGSTRPFYQTLVAGSDTDMPMVKKRYFAFFGVALGIDLLRKCKHPARKLFKMLTMKDPEKRELTGSLSFTEADDLHGPAFRLTDYTKIPVGSKGGMGAPYAMPQVKRGALYPQKKSKRSSSNSFSYPVPRANNSNRSSSSSAAWRGFPDSGPMLKVITYIPNSPKNTVSFDTEPPSRGITASLPPLSEAALTLAKDLKKTPLWKEAVASVIPPIEKKTTTNTRVEASQTVLETKQKVGTSSPLPELGKRDRVSPMKSRAGTCSVPAKAKLAESRVAAEKPGALRLLPPLKVPSMRQTSASTTTIPSTRKVSCRMSSSPPKTPRATTTKTRTTKTSGTMSATKTTKTTPTKTTRDTRKVGECSAATKSLHVMSGKCQLEAGRTPTTSKKTFGNSMKKANTKARKIFMPSQLPNCNCNAANDEVWLMTDSDEAAILKIMEMQETASRPSLQFEDGPFTLVSTKDVPNFCDQPFAEEPPTTSPSSSWKGGSEGSECSDINCNCCSSNTTIHTEISCSSTQSDDTIITEIFDFGSETSEGSFPESGSPFEASFDTSGSSGESPFEASFDTSSAGSKGPFKASFDTTGTGGGSGKSKRVSIWSRGGCQNRSSNHCSSISERSK